MIPSAPEVAGSYRLQHDNGEWRVESEHRRQTVLATVFVVLGATLMWIFRTRTGPFLTGEQAGFSLGLMLAAVGSVQVILNARVAVIVNPARRTVVLETASRFRDFRRTIEFNEVVDVFVDSQVHTDGSGVTYFVTLELRSGEQVALFLGLFAEQHSESLAQERCDKLRHLFALDS